MELVMKSWLSPGRLAVGFFSILLAASDGRSADVDVIFTYGSEKEAWVTVATEAYNQAGHKLADGRRIRILAYPMGSGEAMEELLTGKFSLAPRDPKKYKDYREGKYIPPANDLIELKAHLTSPASGAFIELYNTRARKDPKRGSDLIGPTRNLVLSPVVIAMFEPLARAMGWPDKEIGWADVCELAKDPRGFGRFGQGQFGAFKFAHTHPKASNSGVTAVTAEVAAFALAGVDRELEVADVTNPETAVFLSAIEKSVVHYGESTGFFAKNMFDNGPAYLSAAVLYENLVIESYDRKLHPDSLAYSKQDFPVVAIYPKEGLYYSDHPIGVVRRDGVEAYHREAAENYIKYLLARDQQKLAYTMGFRPAEDLRLTEDEKSRIVDPFVKERGVEPRPNVPQSRLPSGEVLEEILALWDREKKPAEIILVIDRSTSMLANGKMASAQAAATSVIKDLSGRDYFSLVVFNQQVDWPLRDVQMELGRDQARAKIRTIVADGDTALYDAVSQAHQFLKENHKPGYISAVIVLSDGADNKSTTKLEELLKAVEIENRNEATRIFTIHFLAGNMKPIMEDIAKATRAKAFEGRPDTILKVFKEIFYFF